MGVTKRIETGSMAGPEFQSLLQRAPVEKMPTHVDPMLATLVEVPFDEAGWMYEVKWDGYRALAFNHNGKTDLRSRNGESLSRRFYPIVQALGQWNPDAVVDGEIVVVNASGVSSFSRLQTWKSEANGKLLYCVFDMLWYQGRNLMKLPLRDRRFILKNSMPPAGLIHLSDNLAGSCTEVFNAAKKAGLEGIIAKKADSIYRPGARSMEWLKIKATKRQEMIIGGYTRNHGTSRPFSALLAGVFERGKLIYTGKIGTGFSVQDQHDLLTTFKPLLTKVSPFASGNTAQAARLRSEQLHADVFFLRPELVCEVDFTELTADGLMRHPSFQGLRTDKKASDVIMETARSVYQI